MTRTTIERVGSEQKNWVVVRLKKFSTEYCSLDYWWWEGLFLVAFLVSCGGFGKKEQACFHYDWDSTFFFIVDLSFVMII